jgi:hypothetical protein
MGMEILVNGQSGLASTDNDVELGALFNYLRNEYAGKGLVIRRVVLDGQDVFIDEGGPVLSETPEKYQKCEIEVAPLEMVAIDVLVELEANVPQLAAKAVAITEHLQKSEFAKAHKELQRFIDSTQYVFQAVKTINELTGIEMGPVLEAAGLKDDIGALGGHLAGVETAIREEDYATVGDIMEFDVSPSVQTMVRLLSLMRSEIEAELERRYGGDGESGA